MVDIDKVPFFNIPDLTGFALKPYVAHSTAKIDPATRVERQIHLTDELLADIEEQIKNAPKAEVTLNQAAGNVDKWTRR